MESDQNLPFEVGQRAESKSFETGFRGAWFRCEIKDIKMKKGHPTYYLDFYDFPDDKPSETKIYQRPQTGVSSEEKKLHLMVRPSYPPIYRETELPDMCAISEVIAIVDGDWNVGDLVDWWFDDCYWAGRITHLLGEDKVRVQLNKPPMGEGSSYEASCKDLRPSLDWSPERGWTVPISSDGVARQCCARLVQPWCLAIHSEPSQERKSVKSHTTSVSSHGSADASASVKTSSILQKRTRKQLSDYGLVEKTKKTRLIKGLCMGDNVLGKPSSPGSVSSTHVERVSAAAENLMETKDRCISDQPAKKMCIMEQDFLNSVPDTIESSIFDLEELVNKIKWIKRAHQFGFACASAMTPSWKFLEDQPPFRHT